MITGWGESGKVILQVSIGVFFRALSRIFLGKDGSATLYVYRSPMIGRDGNLLPKT